MSYEEAHRRIVREEMTAVLAPLLAEVRGLREGVQTRPTTPPLAEDVLLTTAQAAEVMQVQPVTIRRWVEDGRLTRHGTARALRVSRAELLALKPAARPEQTAPNVTELAAHLLAKQKAKPRR